MFAVASVYVLLLFPLTFNANSGKSLYSFLLQSCICRSFIILYRPFYIDLQHHKAINDKSNTTTIILISTK